MAIVWHVVLSMPLTVSTLKYVVRPKDTTGIVEALRINSDKKGIIYHSICSLVHLQRVCIYPLVDNLKSESSRGSKSCCQLIF